MKVRASVKRICNKCKVIRRRGRHSSDLRKQKA